MSFLALGISLVVAAGLMGVVMRTVVGLAQ
jgi:hypothetical protein